MSGSVLAIDYGTTYTSAAVRGADGRVTVLEVDGVRRLPSLVVNMDGELVAGASAEHLATMYPERTERSPKRVLGVHKHLLLGGEAVRTVDAVAAVLEMFWAEACRRDNGTPPARVCLTHPVRWSATRTEALVEAATIAGIEEPVLLAEPVAAAMHYASDRVAVGDHVAVYDLGGGTFDTAVLRRTDDGFELAGPPGGDDHFGGEDLDHRLANYLADQLAGDDAEVATKLAGNDDPAWNQASAQLRTAARHAKEALSRHTTTRVVLPAPVNRELRITRPELEELIHEDIARTVDELFATVSRAGLEATDVQARYLTGGSSRIPLVSRLVHEAFAHAPDTYDDPKTAVALGATLSAASAPATEVADGDDPTIAALSPTIADAVDGEEEPAPGPHTTDDAGPGAGEPTVVEAIAADAVTSDDPTTIATADPPDEDDEDEEEVGRRRVALVLGTAAAAMLLLAAAVVAIVSGNDDGETDTVELASSDPGSPVTDTVPESSDDQNEPEKTEDDEDDEDEKEPEGDAEKPDEETFTEEELAFLEGFAGEDVPSPAPESGWTGGPTGTGSTDAGSPGSDKTTSGGTTSGGTTSGGTDPAPSFTASISGPTSRSVDQSGTYTATGNQPIQGVTWNWGNGRTTSGKTVDYYWSSAGNYTVTATIRSTSGAVVTRTMGVSVSAPAPMVNISGPTTVSIYNGATYGADTSNANTGTWSWNCVREGAGSAAWGGPGSYASFASPVRDSCTLTLSVSGPGGSRSDTMSITWCDAYACGA